MSKNVQVLEDYPPTRAFNTYMPWMIEIKAYRPTKDDMCMYNTQLMIVISSLLYFFRYLIRNVFETSLTFVT